MAVVFYYNRKVTKVPFYRGQTWNFKSWVTCLCLSFSDPVTKTVDRNHLREELFLLLLVSEGSFHPGGKGVWNRKLILWGMLFLCWLSLSLFCPIQTSPQPQVCIWCCLYSG